MITRLWKRFGIWIPVLAVYVFLFAPMVVLAILSVNSAPRGATWEGFTWDWYLKLSENPSILEALGHSLSIAFRSTLLSAVLGLCVGWVMVRGSKFSRGFLEQVSTLPILLPDIILGLSLLCFFVWIAFPLGTASVVVAHAAVGTAYVAVLVRARLLAMDPLLEDAAADLGAHQFRTFALVTFPQIWPALLSGMLIAFTLSFDDFIVAFFTAGVGATTLPLKIYSMMKFGITPEVNVLSVLILIVSTLLVSCAFWIQSRSRPQTT